MTDSRRGRARGLLGALGAQLPHLLPTIRLMLRACPGITAIWGILLILQGCLPAASIPATAAAVNGFAAAIRNGSQADLTAAVLLAALAGGLMLAAEVAGFAIEWLHSLQAELIQDLITSSIHEQSERLDILFYDSPEFFDRLHRARSEATHRPPALLQAVGSLLRDCITFASLVILLFRFGPVIPGILLAGAIPAFYLSMRQNIRQHEFLRRAAVHERHAVYYDWLLTARDAAAELRLFRLGPHIRSLYRRVRSGLREERSRLARTAAIQNSMAGAITLLVTGAAALWMLSRVVHGSGTIGDVIFFGQAILTAAHVSRQLVQDVAHFYANSMFLGGFFDFLAMRPAIVSGTRTAPASGTRTRSSVRFRNVWFRYPHTASAALSDIDLEIQPGQICAIVGPNGAGKSTLVKLLCRLYDPTEGSIEIDGIDLRDWPLDALRRSIGALFQEPIHYNATVRENIGWGNIENTAAASVEAAAAAAGADEIVRHLPRNYETTLGNWLIEGAELSVGEWQRIALARALASPSSLLVLDEPTSAMDPWAEAAWLDGIRDRIHGRTSILITHRLTTAAIADIIYVIENGRIAESGKHSDLIRRGGSYALWCRSQSL